MSQKTLKEKVEVLLRDFPQSRNCDKQLVLKYWENYDNIPMGDINSFKNGFLKSSTSMESITRARRLLQEEGKYLPTDKTVLGRRRKKIKMESAIIRNREVV